MIDDSRVIRNMVKNMLPPTNFEVLEAQDGVSGLEMIKEHQPWMILLDFILPKMSGFDVYQNLQDSRELATIPLVIMSGRKQEVTEKISEPIDAHYLAFLEKPFEQRNLVEAIKKALELGKQKGQKLDADARATVSADLPSHGGAIDPAIFARLSSLEEKVTLLEEENKRLKLLEQQVVTQHKQIQQLVAFVKQKLS
ncbi:MAG: response regulator [Pseudanabaenaceae cyanobacterium bins.68]|nr:response regulator [Pseudanabaenaceae cyanobacterium bins.68]